jgi:hypothetical protein
MHTFESRLPPDGKEEAADSQPPNGGASIVLAILGVLWLRAFYSPGIPHPADVSEVAGTSSVLSRAKR